MSQDLFSAIDSNNEELIEQLYKKGTNFNEQLFDQTPLLYASQKKTQKEIFQKLIQFGSNINCKDKNTPLHYACLYNASLDIISLLISSGASISSKNVFNLIIK
ncbi:cyclin-dependent kinase inhibitor 2c [Anaeramoeba ignava]|uniref:Cyclin-dependent kinase inhibitor 2c n=1 Tax=Anaeramoeba ignava TaxID=1746090 RepID=A0A9Q0LUK4_ANAIG|nr:cyclin-dependent kinase inhibitor 2c [Anaeramoeba ignava]